MRYMGRISYRMPVLVLAITLLTEARYSIALYVNFERKNNKSLRTKYDFK